MGTGKLKGGVGLSRASTFLHHILYYPIKKVRHLLNPSPRVKKQGRGGFMGQCKAGWRGGWGEGSSLGGEGHRLRRGAGEAGEGWGR